MDGFDYTAGEECSHTAREWNEIRDAILKAGGFAKWYCGELWLRSAKLTLLYEIYYQDKPP
jgi:hypothetical protein